MSAVHAEGAPERDPLVRAALAAVDPDTPALLLPLARALVWVHLGMVALGMVALLVASGVLTYSVVTRYLTHASTDWQDEAAVFCLVGATFLCAGFVQTLRGHVGIEALAGWMPPKANALRLALVDVMGFAFCGFFAWKSALLLHEAWTEGQTTSSTWAPPLWIPYALMTLGMALLTVQLLVQCSARANTLRKRWRGGQP